MNKNINLCEILKDCPKGMELYSPLCGKCVFDHLNMGTIICKKQNTQEITFTSEGYYMLPVFDDCECMIFPSKDQRDWNKFQRPFKDGDVIYNKCIDALAIFNKQTDDATISHCFLTTLGKLRICHYHARNLSDWNFATKEEKEKLFQALKDNGYEWNAETKNLEELIKPKFKVGDIIWDKDLYKVKITDINAEDGFYTYESLIAKGIGTITFNDQYDWELVEYRVGDHFIDPNNNNRVFVITKIQNNGNYSIESLGEIYYPFEMNELHLDKYIKINKWNPKWLKPFDKVLVRDTPHDPWIATLFSHIGNTKEFPYVTSYSKNRYCIPYNIETEHLIGITLEEPEFYKF